jgi:hypothetical protein
MRRLDHQQTIARRHIFFFEVFDDDLLTTDFLRGGVFTFDMFAKNNQTDMIVKIR